jgi:hypothetical protein
MGLTKPFMNTSTQKPLRVVTLPSVPAKFVAVKSSNFRMVTQRAVDEVVNYIRKPEPKEWSFSNTSIEVDEDCTLTVSIQDNPILRVTRTDDNKDFDKVFVFAGGVYDHDGNPSDTTKERLNGLLNALGWCGVIPPRVRVFFDPEFSLTYFGSGENKIALNYNYCVMASILASPTEFIFDNDMIIPRNPTDR